MSNNQNQGASIEAERAEFEAEVRKLDLPADALACWPDGRYLQEPIESMWSGWQMARRTQAAQADCTPAAAVGEGELPQWDGAVTDYGTLGDAPAAQQAAPANYVLMPKRLTAENGAKGALSGEFKETISVTCHECDGSGDDDEYDAACAECNGVGTLDQDVPVSWDTIKSIYKAAVELLASPATAGMVGQDAKNAAGELYTCKGKGGAYELIGEAKGAGTCKPGRAMVYRDTKDGAIYFRSLDDFAERMGRAAMAAQQAQASAKEGENNG